MQGADQHPIQIGPYRILRVLGEGGMGVVYAAEQTQPVKRRVALKLLRGSLAFDEFIIRFEAERQALAVMDHPNIAKILDAGTAETGCPFFVMEHVDGMPITEYCDTKRLTTKERLALFVGICRAIQHAHQKGVIHRDLKPSNVLVSEQEGSPSPKVIDFGIAKAVGMRLTDKTLATATGIALGTPAYMSPEQAEGTGLDVDTRADIYALGVMLYELLVGRVPVEPDDVGLMPFIMQLVTRTTNPPTPSDRLTKLNGDATEIAEARQTEPGALRRELKGDLDWIVMKAIEPERERRYETANGLAMDIARYLNQEPVLARPPSTRYRLEKFVQRNRLAVSAAAAIVTLLIGSTVVTTVQARRIAGARAQAEVRRDQAEELISFMVGDLRGKLEPIGRLDILVDIGNHALEYFAAVPEGNITDEELFRRGQALSQIGEVRLDQGNLPAAREAFEEALTLNLDLVNRAPENTEWQVGLGAAHFWIGFVHWRIGDLDDALEQFQQYLAISEGLVERDSTNLDWQLELGYAHSNMGSVLQKRGDLEGALREFATTQEIFQKLVDSDRDNTTWQLDLADSHNTKGDVLRAQGKLTQALAEYREEVRIKQALADRDPSNTNWRSRLATGLNRIGLVFETRAELDSALAHFRAAVAIWSELVAGDPTNLRWRRGLATNHATVGLVLRAQRHLDGAIEQFRLVERLREELATTDPTDPGLARDQARAYTRLGEVLHLVGDTGGGLVRVRNAQSILDSLVEGDPNDREARRLRSEAYNTLGLIRFSGGNRRLARDAWVESVETIASVARGSDDMRFLTPWARALLYLDRVEEAKPLVDRLEALGYRNDEFAELVESKGLSNSLHVLSRE